MSGRLPVIVNADEKAILLRIIRKSQINTIMKGTNFQTIEHKIKLKPSWRQNHNIRNFLTEHSSLILHHHTRTEKAQLDKNKKNLQRTNKREYTENKTAQTVPSTRSKETELSEKHKNSIDKAHY